MFGCGELDDAAQMSFWVFSAHDAGAHREKFCGEPVPNARESGPVEPFARVSCGSAREVEAGHQ